jgi:hypothetical protein
MCYGVRPFRWQSPGLSVIFRPLRLGGNVRREAFPADPATLLDDISAPAAPIGLYREPWKDLDVDHS